MILGWNYMELGFLDQRVWVLQWVCRPTNEQQPCKLHLLEEFFFCVPFNIYHSPRLKARYYVFRQRSNWWLPGWNRIRGMQHNCKRKRVLCTQHMLRWSCHSQQAAITYDPQMTTIQSALQIGPCRMYTAFCCPKVVHDYSALMFTVAHMRTIC